MARAAEAVGIHAISIQRYAKANPWFDRILTAAIARADRNELLGSLEQWAKYEAGEISEPPAMFESVLPLGPPAPKVEPPEPDPVPSDPSVLPESYATRSPVQRHAETSASGVGRLADSSEAEVVTAAPVLVADVELVGQSVSEFLGIDQDLVDDANKDLARVGLPSMEAISVMVVNIVNDRTHPACATMCRELVRAAWGPAQIAHARRMLAEARRERSMPVIDVEATEQSSGLVVLVVPPKDAVV